MTSTPDSSAHPAEGLTDGVYAVRERVRYGDLDTNGHVNNVVYLRWFETGRVELMRALLGGGPATDGGLDVILAELRTSYRAPAHYDEDVDVLVGVGEVKGSSFEIPFRLSVGDRVVAEGEGWLVAYDYAAAESTPLPDDARAALERAAADGAARLGRG